MSEIASKPYRPAMACDRCCFGGRQHADWCDWRVRFVRGGGTWGDFIDPEDWRDEINESKRRWAASTRDKPVGGSDATPTATESALNHIPATIISNYIPGMIISKSLSSDTVAFFATRLPHEPEEEWLKRCAVIKNLKEKK